MIFLCLVLSCFASELDAQSTPIPQGFVSVPGFANNVAVSGKYAYVAAGATGLQIVNVSDPYHPVIVAALDTPGNANDVTIVGSLAYVADGTAGLRIIDIAIPQAPLYVGSVDTAGDAWDVVVKNNHAYVADGSSGLVIVDVSDPANPQIVGLVDPPGTQKGVDVDPLRNVAVLASGSAGVHIVDVSDASQPAMIGSLPISGGDVRDVVLSGKFAFLADSERGFTSVDLTSPSTPVLAGSIFPANGGRLQDVAVSGNLAVGADVLFVNAVPIIDISGPANPIPRATLDFAFFRDDDGQGVAIDGSVVYLTTVHGGGAVQNGATGDSRLYIGQYPPLNNRNVPLAISNASFETASLPLDGGNGPYSNLVAGSSLAATGGTLANWTANASTADATAGAYFPTIGGVNWTSLSWTGNNVAYLQTSSAGSVSLSQTLADGLQSNTSYTLSAKVGNRSYSALLNYSLQLWAGSTLLSSTGGLPLVDNTFSTDRLVYSSGPGNPASGQPLTIVLSSTWVAGITEAFFDDVSLTSVQDLPKGLHGQVTSQ